VNEIRCIQPVAEPRRREILNYLALQERSVSEVVQVFGPFPGYISKWKMSTTIWVLWFISTMCPPTTTFAQSGGGGGNIRSISRGQGSIFFCRPGGSVPRRTSCFSNPGGK